MLKQYSELSSLANNAVSVAPRRFLVTCAAQPQYTDTGNIFLGSFVFFS